MILRPAKYTDAIAVGENLRACDRHELSLSQPGVDPVVILKEARLVSVIREVILTDDGRHAGLWGVTQHPLDNTGTIWMVATDLIHEVAFPFLRECPRAIGRAHAHFDTLVCAPWRENKLHLTWLDWCGFTPVEFNHPHFLPHVRTYNHRGAHDAGSVSHRGSGAEQRHEQGD